MTHDELQGLAKLIRIKGGFQSVEIIVRDGDQSLHIVDTPAPDDAVKPLSSWRTRTPKR